MSVCLVRGAQVREGALTLALALPLTVALTWYAARRCEKVQPNSPGLKMFFSCSSQYRKPSVLRKSRPSTFALGSRLQLPSSRQAPTRALSTAGTRTSFFV